MKVDASTVLISWLCAGLQGDVRAVVYWFCRAVAKADLVVG